MVADDNITLRMSMLRMKAAMRYNISPEKCHVGHVALEGMLQSPRNLHQIDGATGEKETNLSVATRSMRVASALCNYGLKPGDAVIIMGPNHINLAIPYYACHFSGFSMTSVDPGVIQDELNQLFPYIQPKAVFCQKDCVEKVTKSAKANNMEIPIITFDDKENDMEIFIKKYNGTEVNFRPAQFNTAKVAAWLMLTSGTTGVPKVAIITFDTLYNGVIEWWNAAPEQIGITMTMTSTQWLSALMFYISTPLKPFTRLQSSAPMTPQVMVHLINTYKPNATAWTPYLLAQFVLTAEGVCDLSPLKVILVGGSAMEKPILEQFKKRCKARLVLAYGMTELLVPVFDFDETTTPFGAAGKPFPHYQYKLVDDNDKTIEETNESGELCIRGDAFFSGYLNNPEETDKMVTTDGWIRTGDIFRRDEDNYFYFVERKKLLIRYTVHWISPLQLEEVIKRHPGVAEACVVGIPNAKTMELPVGVIKRKNGNKIPPQEIFDLLKSALPELRQLHGGLFFVDSFPQTPSGKINRSKVTEMALTAERTVPK